MQSTQSTALVAQEQGAGVHFFFFKSLINVYLCGTDTLDVALYPFHVYFIPSDEGGTAETSESKKYALATVWRALVPTSAIACGVELIMPLWNV